MPILTIQITDEFRHRYAELPAVVKKKTTLPFVQADQEIFYSLILA
jgi:hypothetical protein